eukprot:TRINITY_DN32915_c0_g1_i4.p1 TRINITY_DN32915_c0_g1~~TRINITY_DN32915_c0_g1_i4.p1  ORF type:complete len:1056 (-),score=129.06 TRINITY_DN32915_c0_g1_i4:98-3265(-)
MQNCFKLGRAVGTTWYRSNSGFQGCPIVSICVNAHVTVWANAIERLTSPQPAICVAYLDDRPFHCKDPTNWKVALDLTDQELNEDKTEHYALQQKSKAALTAHGVKLVGAATNLGVQQIFSRKLGHTLANRRVDDALALLDRMRPTGLPVELRERPMTTAVAPTAYYGVDLTHPGGHKMQPLRRKMMSMLWGKGRATTNAAMALIYKGHRIDPMQAPLCLTLDNFRRIVSKHQHLYDLAKDIWAMWKSSDTKVPGIVDNVFMMTKKLGWGWEEFDNFTRPGLPALPLVLDDLDRWRHELGQAARWSVLREATKRLDMRQLSEHDVLDIHATTALLRAKLGSKDDKYCLCSCYQQGILRSILAGAVWSASKATKAKLTTSPRCQICESGDNETMEHIFFDCEAYQHIRNLPIYDLVWLDWRNWSPAKKNCGHITLEPEVMTLQLAVDEHEDPDKTWYLGGDMPTHGLHHHAGKVVAYTDGSATSTDSFIARAGAGVWYGRGHPWNMQIPVATYSQTNNRAELKACWAAMSRATKPTLIKQDSQWVVTRVQKLLTGTGRDNSWKHADLWIRIEDEITKRPTDFFDIMHIPGQITDDMIEARMATAQEKEGNDGADELAKAATQHYHMDQQLLAEHKASYWKARQLQKMMVEIIEQRNALLKERNIHYGDENDQGDAERDDDSNAAPEEDGEADAGPEEDEPVAGAIADGGAAQPRQDERAVFLQRARSEFPGYAWDFDRGAAPLDVDFSDTNGLTKAMNSYGAHWIEPLMWYLKNLKWAPPDENAKPKIQVTWLELLLDFEASTHLRVTSMRKTDSEDDDVFTRARLLSRMMQRLCGHQGYELELQKYSNGLYPLGFDKLIGLESRPNFLQKEYVEKTLYDATSHLGRLTSRAHRGEGGGGVAGRAVAASWKHEHADLPLPKWAPTIGQRSDKHTWLSDAVANALPSGGRRLTKKQHPDPVVNAIRAAAATGAHLLGAGGELGRRQGILDKHNGTARSAGRHFVQYAAGEVGGDDVAASDRVVCLLCRKSLTWAQWGGQRATGEVPWLTLLFRLVCE